MAAKRKKKLVGLPMPLPVMQATSEEARRLQKAGFAPVVRWVDVANRGDHPYKTIEALTLIERRRELFAKNVTEATRKLAKAASRNRR